MNVGIGLPIGDPTTLLTWARRADAGPFSTLGLLDRLVYDNPEPLVALAVLAGATSRIRVQTEVLLAPLRDTALLAKQAATVDRMTGGRLVLGLGIGGRDDDHRAAGTDPRTRGRRLDEQMAVMRRLWSGEPYGDGVGPIGPAPARPTGPEVLFGGFRPAALERVARWGDGFLAAAAPSWADGLFETVRTYWRRYGRDGEPRLVAQVNVALGPQPVIDEARAALHAYYAFTGMADRMVAGMLTTPTGIRDTITAFAGLGADEVMLYCHGLDPAQVDRLADAL
ncbi:MULTISPECIES: LLM class flavin-dependent oxidoreductase [unclassified Streptomyces]|uniref:LLM class flavin-dependent oxidoreductase n=1 Tax=unclassified Streptomyces TaxID=2593676 RepID=UPI00048E49DA|nr:MULTISPECIES: LLM class flavin-dependent oxidoreductase [unclassified Streptomyces]MYY17712.1 LLM class flavin-dependent oxidoreductase [Streptomyces sp. SID4912]SCE34897.1 Flavin-dependent oxidoreductase, luciferase family (includes alkanesulfonate monooxygenase SsuD and methylene tetrahydromethanopterin reductase) [Streptomyces sp. DpondAA-D4]